MNNKIIVALVGALSLFSCTSYAMAQDRARAELKNAQGSTVGTASLRETKEGLLIVVNAKGLPEGLHAVHIHSIGKCEAPDFTSAGGHFNPLDKKHGLKQPRRPARR